VVTELVVGTRNNGDLSDNERRRLTEIELLLRADNPGFVQRFEEQRLRRRRTPQPGRPRRHRCWTTVTTRWTPVPRYWGAAARGAGVRVLATSRQPLGMLGEQVQEVPALPVPATDRPLPAGA
jgi:hypothetical protein